MRESMYKYMKVGIVHFMAFPSTMSGEGPVLETLEKIAEDSYFTLVEVTSIKDSEVRRKARELLESSHLEIRFAAQPIILGENLNLNSFNEEERLKAVERIKGAIEEAIELGAVGLALMSGRDPGPEKREEAISLLADSLRRICDYASERSNGFSIALEIFDREIDKMCLIGSTEDARKVAEMVDRKNFGLLHDLSHLPLLKESPKEALEPVKDYLIHVHVGNCVIDEESPLYGDKHPRFGVKGGANDVEEVKEFIKVLMEIGYLDGRELKPFSFEIKPMEGEKSEIIISNAKRVLNEAWARL